MLQTLKSLLPDPLGRALEPHARVLFLRPGQIILGFGDTSSDVYVILEGKVQAELHSPNGREVILGDLGVGAIFGEIAALDGQPRSANVTAMSDCVVASIPGAIFCDAVFADPGTARWMARHFAARIRLLTEKIFELNTLAVRNRLHCELLRLCAAAGVESNCAVIDPAPTHVQLAGRIGTHREAVTRELQYLLKKNILAQQRRQLVVNDVAALAQIVRAAGGDAATVEQGATARTPLN